MSVCATISGSTTTTIYTSTLLLNYIQLYLCYYCTLTVLLPIKYYQCTTSSSTTTVRLVLVILLYFYIVLHTVLLRSSTSSSATIVLLWDYCFTTTIIMLVLLYMSCTTAKYYYNCKTSSIVPPVRVSFSTITNVGLYDIPYDICTHACRSLPPKHAKQARHRRPCSPIDQYLFTYLHSNLTSVHPQRSSTK